MARFVAAEQGGRWSSAGVPVLAVTVLAAVACLSTAIAAPAAVTLPSTPSFSFGAAGDFGYSAQAQSTFLTAGASGIDFFLALGDTTYNETTESNWCSKFRAEVPHVLVQAGNHDTGENTGADIDALLAACPYDLDEALTGTYGREWFFDYPGESPIARFIFTGCGTSFVSDNDSTWSCASGDAHYTFVSDAIDDARDHGVHWVIVALHKNCISAGTKTCEIGAAFFGMLLDKRVDLILQGHDHLYGRSKQIVCATPGSYDSACVTDDGSDGLYTKGSGTVLLIDGTGGKSPYAWNPADSEAGYFATGFSGTFGFSKFSVNLSAISVQFTRSAGGSDNDSFMIETPEMPRPPLPPKFMPGFDLVEVAVAVAACALVGSRPRRPAGRKY